MTRPELPSRPPRIALVLGGGGLKGFAHIGVLQALEARGIRPAVLAGASIGSLAAAAYACGASVDQLAERALAVRKPDLFRLDHMAMALERMRAPALYLAEPMRALVRSVVPRTRFRDLATPLLVNTVDVERGIPLVWGLPGFDDVWVDDAVYASCALPGFFPPGLVGGHRCMDGGVLDNLPSTFAATLGVDAIIGVEVGSSQVAHARTPPVGFASVFMRAATVAMSALQRGQLPRHSSPPLLLVRPALSHVDWFTFGLAGEVIEAGRRAAESALDELPEVLAATHGVFPRRRVQVTVDRARCVGCGVCVARAPELMTMDAGGRAHPLHDEVEWSPADGDFVRQCPTHAIWARELAEPGLIDRAELPVPELLRPPSPASRAATGTDG